MLAIDKMATDYDNAALVPIDGPKQWDITKELDHEMGLDNRDLEVKMDNLNFLEEQVKNQPKPKTPTPKPKPKPGWPSTSNKNGGKTVDFSVPDTTPCR